MALPVGSKNIQRLTINCDIIHIVQSKEKSEQSPEDLMRPA